MPEVIVKIQRRAKRGDGVIHNETAFEMGQMLREVVAHALSCDGGELTPDDVDVEISFLDPRLSSGYRDVSVRIEANDYPPRRIDLNHRCRAIHETLTAWLGNRSTSSSVWVRLSTAAYSQS